MSKPSTEFETCLRQLAQDGHCLLPAATLLPLLQAQGSLADWPAFAQSWEAMPLDTYMADRGRYRRRRHGVFRAQADGSIQRLPAQPHYQSVDYNPLNGGIERWFAPMGENLEQGTLGCVLRLALSGFGSLRPAARSWFVEAHQFRIEAQAGTPGLPTPEGVHRDGVDYVLVLLIRRHNIESGVTSIHAPDGRSLGSFTLREPGDCCLIDDARVFHGVTAVHAQQPGEPAFRDVLVLTFKRER
ncbi:hypothetical protein SAMN04488038_105218 [Solimonas aquatica]|uniref:2OG-Fe dioxygenase n=1 Tax=Solimonas aquatica TaxID=489703 RepID=A0A1H9F2I9_9GAMM|nr:2OG-Fe dioxygenase family protein [Solimonas aquatica]SEQ31448.1 hypothetical protein SAMN04488038_105218 [Solimonas aquatica]